MQCAKTPTQQADLIVKRLTDDTTWGPCGVCHELADNTGSLYQPSWVGHAHMVKGHSSDAGPWDFGRLAAGMSAMQSTLARISSFSVALCWLAVA